jgi:two-component system, LytTR family, response regulator
MNTIILPTFSGRKEVSLADIVRLEGAGNYTEFILNDGQRLIFSKTIALFEEQFPFPFVRIHKSCIVNLAYLTETWKRGKKQLSLHDGTEVPISRRRRKEVRLQVQQFSRQNVVIS